MKYFKLQINTEAYADIQEGIDWYNKKRKGHGKAFHLEVKDGFEKLKSLSFFQIRYDQTRCLPLEKFTFMTHYTVGQEKELIIVLAVFNTFRNPDIWKNGLQGILVKKTPILKEISTGFL